LEDIKSQYISLALFLIEQTKQHLKMGIDEIITLPNGIVLKNEQILEYYNQALNKISQIDI
jgi:hypothetical protein